MQALLLGRCWVKFLRPQRKGVAVKQVFSSVNSHCFIATDVTVIDQLKISETKPESFIMSDLSSKVLTACKTVYLLKVCLWNLSLFVGYFLIVLVHFWCERLMVYIQFCTPGLYRFVIGLQTLPLIAPIDVSMHVSSQHDLWPCQHDLWPLPLTHSILS